VLAFLTSMATTWRQHSSFHIHPSD